MSSTYIAGATGKTNYTPFFCIKCICSYIFNIDIAARVCANDNRTRRASPYIAVYVLAVASRAGR